MYKGGIIWNALPDNVKNSENLEMFKYNLKPGKCKLQSNVCICILLSMCGTRPFMTLYCVYMYFTCFKLCAAFIFTFTCVYCMSLLLLLYIMLRQDLL